jgi:hypothetical protein
MKKNKEKAATNIFKIIFAPIGQILDIIFRGRL